jgi:hypothetical protein
VSWSHLHQIRVATQCLFHADRHGCSRHAVGAGAGNARAGVHIF